MGKTRVEVGGKDHQTPLGAPAARKMPYHPNVPPRARPQV